jgi:O-6-methylguanine DNA methyltransferase
MKSFTQKVLEIVSKIPRGKTMSYGEVAQAAGSPKAARAVGSILAKNRNSKIPCHRVIQSHGGLGSYNGLRGPSKKTLLENEGAV